MHVGNNFILVWDIDASSHLGNVFKLFDLVSFLLFYLQLYLYTIYRAFFPGIQAIIWTWSAGDGKLPAREAPVQVSLG